jgi:hypothetical protein
VFALSRTVQIVSHLLVFDNWRPIEILDPQSKELFVGLDCMYGLNNTALSCSTYCE